MGELIVKGDILVKVRWALDRDVTSCCKLDLDEKNGWEAADFKKFKKMTDNVALVAELGNQIVAYIMLSVMKDRIKIARLMVTNILRRHNIGSQLIDRIKIGFLKKERHCIFIELDEYNVVGQLFLRNNGFIVTEVRNDYGNDAYLMQFFK